jgi:hypothetical protein
MDSESFYCIAAADRENDSVAATVAFPTPLNTSNARYEAAIVYCSLVPNWSKITDLWIHATSVVKDEKGNLVDTSWKISFDEVQSYMEPEYLLPIISKKLVEELGNNMTDGTAVKLYDAGGFMGWWLKVNKHTEVQFSPSLANILGQATTISNSESTVIQYPVKTKEISKPDDVYYLISNQIRPNCLNEYGGAMRLLDSISVHNQVVRYWPSERKYQPLEDDILHPQLHIQLINRSGNVVHTHNPDLYILLHVRKNGASDDQRKLA